MTEETFALIVGYRRSGMGDDDIALMVNLTSRQMRRWLKLIECDATSPLQAFRTAYHLAWADYVAEKAAA